MSRIIYPIKIRRPTAHFLMDMDTAGSDAEWWKCFLSFCACCQGAEASHDLAMTAFCSAPANSWYDCEICVRSSTNQGCTCASGCVPVMSPAQLQSSTLLMHSASNLRHGRQETTICAIPGHSPNFCLECAPQWRRCLHVPNVACTSPPFVMTGVIEG